MKLERAKGTRDFPPEEKLLRDETISKIINLFEKYGFSPLETPIIERYDVMTAKAGSNEDADVYKETFSLEDNGKRKLGLRFELTFQLARFIGMNPQVKLPFKRYQIGDVFRDGPIKSGRYREFTQCDVDIVGSKELIAEAEILSLISDVFKELDINIIIEVNNRKLLTEIMNFAKIEADLQNSVMITLDKLNKISIQGVKSELIEKNISSDKIDLIVDLISIKGNNEEIIEKIINKIGECDAIKELKELFSLNEVFNTKIKFNPSLARGLGYYTGTVFEVVMKEKSVIDCSLAGGGRWNNMISKYLGNEKLNYPAVGVGIGLEPIMEILKEKIGLDKKSKTKIYLISIQTTNETIKIAQELRRLNVNTSMDLSKKGISKNLDYANSWKIPYVGIIGEDEIKLNEMTEINKMYKIKVKNMSSGQENIMTLEEISIELQKL